LNFFSKKKVDRRDVWKHVVEDVRDIFFHLILNYQRYILFIITNLFYDLVDWLKEFLLTKALFFFVWLNTRTHVHVQKKRKRERENLASVLKRTIDQCNFCWKIFFWIILLETWAYPVRENVCFILSFSRSF